MTRTESKPLKVACVPAFNEERAIAGVVVGALGQVDVVVFCDDGSCDLTGGILRFEDDASGTNGGLNCA